jgi:AcrR family transcriptional regulator
MKEKVTKRKLQAIETRKRIYDTAKDLFTKYGYEAVSIDDIVQAAGVARGSFYVYFLSKEDLSVYLMMDEISVYQDKITTAWTALDKNLPASDLIVQTACAVCSMVYSWGVETMRTVYKIFIERASTTGISYKSLFEIPHLFTALYDLGVKRNEFRPADTAVIAENIQTMLVGLTYQWCLYHPDFDFVGRAKQLITEYLNGFKI